MRVHACVHVCECMRVRASTLWEREKEREREREELNVLFCCGQKRADGVVARWKWVGMKGIRI